MDALLDKAAPLSTHQRILVAGVALVVLALAALRPTPDVLPDRPSGTAEPVVAEEPSLSAKAG